MIRKLISRAFFLILASLAVLGVMFKPTVSFAQGLVIEGYQPKKAIVGTNVSSQAIFWGSYNFVDFNIAFNYLEIPVNSELALYLTDLSLGEKRAGRMIVTSDEMDTVFSDVEKRNLIAKIVAKSPLPFKALGVENQNLRGGLFETRDSKEEVDIILLKN